MPRVICDLPNASEEISGVKFHPLDDGGRISDEVDAETAEVFASIPGYHLAEDDQAPAKTEAKPAPAKAARAKKAKDEAPAPETPAEDEKPAEAPAADAPTAGEGDPTIF